MELTAGVTASDAEARYRLAPLVVARLVGLALVLLALLLFVGTAVAALAGLPPDLLVVSVVVLVLAILAGAWWLRTRAWVLRCTETGYQVRLVRGAGVTRASWRDVEGLVTTTRRGAPCLELRLRDGRTTTLPVGVLAGDREQLVRDLGDRLTQSQGLRPL